MQYKVYIQNTQGKTISQIDQIFDVSVDLGLSTISTAGFDIFYDDQYASRKYLKVLNPIQICQVIKNKEYVMIDGIIRGIEITQDDKVRIIVNDYNYLLSRRILRKGYTFRNTPIATIFQELRDDTNSHHLLGLTLVMSDMDGTINKDYSMGISLYYVLQDLLNDGYERKIEDRTLFVGKNVGKDRTSGADFLEYVYKKNDGEGSNIHAFSFTTDANELSNGVYFKGNSVSEYTSDSDSISEFGLYENTITDGSSASEYLEEHKSGVEEFGIEISDTNFGKVGIGDTVKVEIHGGNDIAQYTGNMRIIAKQRIGGDLPEVKYTVSTSKILPETILDKIKNAERNIKKLELV